MVSSGRIAALVLVGVAWSGSARADFHAENRQSDFSAFNMNRGELRLGLFQEEYAIFDQWAVGTYLAPWILMPILQGPILNAYTKVELLDIGPRDHDRFALAVRANLLWADVSTAGLQGVEDGAFKGTVLPITLDGSWVFDDVWTVTAESTFVQTWLSGDVDAVGEASALGAVAQRNFQVAAIGEARLGKHVALNLIMRWAPWIQDLRVQSQAQVDESTSTEIDAQVQAAASGRAWLIQPGVTCSWGTFHLQVGVGYGNLFLPGIRVVSAAQTVVPDLDLYFRF